MHYASVKDERQVEAELPESSTWTHIGERAVLKRPAAATAKSETEATVQVEVAAPSTPPPKKTKSARTVDLDKPPTPPPSSGFEDAASFLLRGM